ncbi:MAG TPA: SCO2524 family protein [Micromonosporaceae bacterium]|nr:SCO2524 family protein [Micromonosporaceae bacterium]
MRIEPRKQLLDAWRAMARAAYPDGQWVWGGRDKRNSISDAEQLLCLMGPATDIDSFRLDVPDEIAEDVLDVLRPLGDSVEIPRRLVRVITEYLDTYTDGTGTPVFSGGTYFRSDGRPPTEAQLTLDVVDSYAISVRLMLATIDFVKGFRQKITREDLLREVDALETGANIRLTAAIVGLLRSFAIAVFDYDHEYGQRLCRMVNQAGIGNIRRLVDELNQELREVNAGFRYVTLGLTEPPDLDNPNQLFECGWSWGVVKGAPEVKTSDDIGRQPEGVAQNFPYLYFTVTALESIQDLFSERTRILGLLSEEQQRLARALQIRWDLTQRYWSIIARFGGRRWPVEDIPWRTTDGIASDYLSLLVTSITVQEFATRRTPREDMYRVGEILKELAGRARITRRKLDEDQAVTLHSPGFPVELVGSEDPGGPRLSWLLSDFSPQLLKRTIRVASLLPDAGMRGPLLALADDIWDKHLMLRRLRSGAVSQLGQLWDRPDAIYDQVSPSDGLPSWYFTERVITCLVAAADFVSSPPIRSPGLVELATDLLAEADHLFDQELLKVAAEAGPAMGNALHTVRTTLRRAHETIGDRPGTAYVLASEVLLELDQLARARQSRDQVD